MNALDNSTFRLVLSDHAGRLVSMISRRQFIIRTGFAAGGTSAFAGLGCGGSGGSHLASPPMSIKAYRSQLLPIDSRYSMARTEVTVAMWKEYCAATRQPMPAAPEWGWVDNHPIVFVDWHACNEYALWAGLRLPTGVEWELAATGGDGRNYPWGGYGPSTDGGYTFPGWDENRCANWERGSRSTHPVGSFPLGDSPYGLADMAGNVWEWMADDLDSGKQVRGASWLNNITNNFCSAYRTSVPSTTSYNYIGFRLVADRV